MCDNPALGCVSPCTHGDGVTHFYDLLCHLSKHMLVATTVIKHGTAIRHTASILRQGRQIRIPEWQRGQALGGHLAQSSSR